MPLFTHGYAKIMISMALTKANSNQLVYLAFVQRRRTLGAKSSFWSFTIRIDILKANR
ncbi:hypothetical protein HDF13_000187 [Edaphobacter lichenicola]|uniref:Uncharacterized protein n=1 Tax=Tunturiibacter gelidiferens TaxID=3069689 RepID=A0ACC5NTT4_9BACT|nr:hypothetical protein [Edaphobacter lichenicola]